jgi:hypothetical protein
MAAEPKTRPTDVPPAQFIAGVENAARRADAETALTLLADVTGEPAVMWGSSIVGFGSYRGATGDWPVVGFSPRKAELVLYLALDFPERASLLDRLGASCLYVKKLAEVDMDVLRNLCERAVAASRSRHA